MSSSKYLGEVNGNDILDGKVEAVVGDVFSWDTLLFAYVTDKADRSVKACDHFQLLVRGTFETRQAVMEKYLKAPEKYLRTLVTERARVAASFAAREAEERAVMEARRIAEQAERDARIRHARLVTFVYFGDKGGAVVKTLSPEEAAVMVTQAARDKGLDIVVAAEEMVEVDQFADEGVLTLTLGGTSWLP